MNYAKIQIPARKYYKILVELNVIVLYRLKCVIYLFLSVFPDDFVLISCIYSGVLNEHCRRRLMDDIIFY